MPDTTKRFQRVLQLANREAQRVNHEYIGTEHILLGLIHEGSGVGCSVLRGLGLDLTSVRREVHRLMQVGPDMVTLGRLPLAPNAGNCLELADAEASRAGRATGTGELLLGLLAEQRGLAAQVLLGLGALQGRSLDDVRRAVDAEALRADDDSPPDLLRRGADVTGTSPQTRAAAWASARRHAAVAAVVALPTAALALASAEQGWALAALCVPGVAGVVGWCRGARKARREGARRWEDTLALERRALEEAIAAKFGPLDDARRDAIRNFDQQRIAEVARRLPGATKIDDLDTP
jgi:hypothetical protein